MRVKFSNNKLREDFFSDIKKKIDKSWKEIVEDYNLTKNTLEGYRFGKNSIPEKLFFHFLSLLKESKQKEVLKGIDKIPNNWGQVKGGKNAYKLNKEYFDEGRKKAIISNKIKRTKSFSFDFELNEKICEFAGAFIGDGFFNCYNNKLYQIEFAGDSRFDLDYYNSKIIPIVKEIIPEIKPKLYFRGDNSLRVVFYSKELFCFLRDYLGFVPGKKTHTVKIPDKILNQKEFFPSTIRGIFDTDGGVFLDKRKIYKKKYPRIVFQTVSENLYNQLKEYLLENFKIYHRFNEKRKVYVIEIYGHNQVEKWMSLIGFSNSRHLNRLLQ